MKNTLALYILFFALPLALAGQTVTLTSPHAGEFYPRSGSTRIIWDYNNLQGNVRLILYRGTTNLGVIEDNIPLTQVKYFWTVGQYQGGLAAVGNNYHIRIRVDDPVHGVFLKNGPSFNIGPEQIGTITISNPNPNSKWLVNRKQKITWTKSPGTHSILVHIQLFRGDVSYRTVVNSTENDGSFEWFISEELGAYPNNRLVISNIYTTARTQYFPMQNVILDPLGKNMLTLNSIQNISWQVSSSTLGVARIEIWRFANRVGVIAAITGSNNVTKYKFPWTVGKLLSGGPVKALGGYQIRVIYPSATAGGEDQSALFGIQ